MQHVFVQLIILILLFTAQTLLNLPPQLLHSSHPQLIHLKHNISVSQSQLWLYAIKSRDQLTFTASFLLFASSLLFDFLFSSGSDCESPQGKRPLNIVQINPRDVTYHDVRGGIGGIPHPWRHQKNWERGSPGLYNIARSVVSLQIRYGFQSMYLVWEELVHLQRSHQVLR